jgi:hypothetical protein
MHTYLEGRFLCTVAISQFHSFSSLRLISFPFFPRNHVPSQPYRYRPYFVPATVSYESHATYTVSRLIRHILFFYSESFTGPRVVMYPQKK